MARDFDFRRTPKQAEPIRESVKVPIQKPVVEVPKPVPKPLPPKKKTAAKSKSWIYYLLVVVIVGVASYFYYQSLQPAPQTKTTQTDTASSANDKVKLVIKVYDGGAGQSVLDQTVAMLKEKGYEAESLGKSQFEYDQTYIWYTKDFQADANAVATLLQSRTVTLKESQVSGAFAIQIQLGKK